MWPQMRVISSNSSSRYAGENTWFSLPISSWPSRASYKPLAVAPLRYEPISGYSENMEKAFCASRILQPVRSCTKESSSRF